MATFKPLHDYIWVTPIDEHGNEFAPGVAKVGGILTVRGATTAQIPNKGVVLELGPGFRCEKTGELMPMPQLTTGDLVTWAPGAAITVKYGRDDLYLVQARALIGVVKP